MNLKRYLILVSLSVLSHAVFAQDKPIKITALYTDSVNCGSVQVGATKHSAHEIIFSTNLGGSVTCTTTGPFYTYKTGDDTLSHAVTFDRGFYSPPAYIVFVPTEGGPITGTATISASNSVTIPLSGYGIPRPTVTVSPSSLNFVNVPVGSSYTQLVTVRGTNVLLAANISASGPFVIGSGSGYFTATQLNAGVKVAVTYTAKNSLDTGTMTVNVPGGYSWDGAPPIIKTVALSGHAITGTIDTTKENAIKANGDQLLAADPIQLGTGTYYYAHSDLNISDFKTTLNFKRFYNSFNNSVNGKLGYGWSHSYSYILTRQPNPTNNTDERWTIRYPE